jgi:hypothetical protein
MGGVRTSATQSVSDVPVQLLPGSVTCPQSNATPGRVGLLEHTLQDDTQTDKAETLQDVTPSNSLSIHDRCL